MQVKYVYFSLSYENYRRRGNVIKFDSSYKASSQTPPLIGIKYLKSMCFFDIKGWHTDCSHAMAPTETYVLTCHAGDCWI